MDGGLGVMYWGRDEKTREKSRLSNNKQSAYTLEKP